MYRTDGSVKVRNLTFVHRRRTEKKSGERRLDQKHRVRMQKGYGKRRCLDFSVEKRKGSETIGLEAMQETRGNRGVRIFSSFSPKAKETKRRNRGVRICPGICCAFQCVRSHGVPGVVAAEMRVFVLNLTP